MPISLDSNLHIPLILPLPHQANDLDVIFPLEVPEGQRKALQAPGPELVDAEQSAQGGRADGRVALEVLRALAMAFTSLLATAVPASWR